LKRSFINSNPHLHKEKEMVDFRKALLVLAVLVFATGIASAQLVNPLQCVASSGVPPIARAEGVAEEVGQVIIRCTGGTPTPLGAPISTVNVQIFLNTFVTSRLLDATTLRSEAMLLIDEPQPGNQFYAGAAPFTGVVTGNGNGVYGPSSSRPNIFGAQQASDSSLVWLNIPFDPPGSVPERVIRLVNVRANANRVGVSSTLIPSAINMFISVSGTGSLGFSNTQLTVAYVQKGLTFSATTATYNQCEPGTKTFNVKFAENFGTAFRFRGSTVTQDVPGRIYNSESMFWGPAFGSDAATVGVATQATRLIAKFSNVPSNVTLSIPLTVTASTGGDIASVVFSPDSGSTVGSDGTIALTNAAGAAVWNVDSSVAGAISTFTFPISVTYKASPLPATGTASVAGNYAPTTTVFTYSASAPAPRFVDDSTNVSTFTIAPCRTNLLFPFVTNQAGFDTGIVISNTSSDPFGTVPQRGVCKLNYYGGTAGGGAAPGVQTSGVVTEGQQLVLTVSNGGNLGITATPGFQGYIIAQCDFQYAHGFAFISDLGSSRVAEGFLAIVLDSDMFGSQTGRTGAKSEVKAH
jgi:hypothetical protein